MRIKILITILFYLFLFLSCGKDDSAGTQGDESALTLEGTVYADNVPADHVLVEFGVKATVYHPDYASSSKYTDSEGKYTFTQTTGSIGSYSGAYRVRAMNPFTGFWSDYREGTIPLGAKKSQDFYFFSEQR